MNGWGGDPLGIVQETNILPFHQILYEQTRIPHGEWDTQNSVGFKDTIPTRNQT